MNLIIYFKLVRWKNILLISYVFYLIKFQLFKTLHVKLIITDFQFFNLLISVIAITAAGYIINDIFDIKADEINKPQKVIVSKSISIEKAKRWYQFTNAAGLISGIGLCLKIEKPTYSFIFIGGALLLYYYAKIFKGKPVIGNVIISFLVSFSLFIIPLFTLNFSVKIASQNLAINIILVLSIIAFGINLVREIVNDIEGVDGDNCLHMKTLPILIGRLRTKQSASFVCFFPILILFYIIYRYSEIYKITGIYLLLSCLLPLLYVAVKLKAAKSKKQLHKINILLKIIMVFALNSLLIFSINY